MIEKLSALVRQNQNLDPLILRNILKERLQIYILKCIFASSYAPKLIFTGGTCLRHCFYLPRLSEDLDFDSLSYTTFSHAQLIDLLKDFFKKEFDYSDMITSISGSSKILYLKFPIGDQIGLPLITPGSHEGTLHIRIDVAQAPDNMRRTELSLKTLGQTSFIIRRYSLSDLFTLKIAAIIGRKKLQGKELITRFKGRDYFDYWWYTQQNIKPDIKFLQIVLGLTSESLVELLSERLNKALIEKQQILADIAPFIENQSVYQAFVESLPNLPDTANRMLVHPSY